MKTWLCIAQFCPVWPLCAQRVHGLSATTQAMATLAAPTAKSASIETGIEPDRLAQDFLAGAAAGATGAALAAAPAATGAAAAGVAAGAATATGG